MPSAGSDVAEPLVAVIIPAHDEAGKIGRVLDKLPRDGRFSKRAATTLKPPTRRDSPMWPPHYCRPLAQHAGYDPRWRGLRQPRPGRIRQRRLTLAFPAPPDAFRLGLGLVERRADLAQGLSAVTLLGAEETLGPSVKALRVAVVVRLSSYVPGRSFGHALTVAKSQQSGREPEAGVTGSRHPRPVGQATARSGRLPRKPPAVPVRHRAAASGSSPGPPFASSLHLVGPGPEDAVV
jgi:hypothetical protein